MAFASEKMNSRWKGHGERDSLLSGVLRDEGRGTHLHMHLSSAVQRTQHEAEHKLTWYIPDCTAFLLPLTAGLSPKRSP